MLTFSFARIFSSSHIFNPNRSASSLAVVDVASTLCVNGPVFVLCRHCCIMMEKYRLVEEYRGEGDDFLEEESSVEEVRITHLGKPKNYISYAMSLFVSRNGPEEVNRLAPHSSASFTSYV